MPSIFLCVIGIFSSLRPSLEVSSSTWALDSLPPICYQIKELEIYNNKRTKRRLFVQEMRLQLDSTYCSSDWAKLLAKDQAWLYGTGLFDTVRVMLKPLSPHQARLEVSVKERWYIYPRPIISFGQYSSGYWWNDLNRSFKYISYGVGLSHYNLRGLNDRFSMIIRLGHEPALLFRYTGPDFKYPSGRLLGYGISASYVTAHSRIYENIDHNAVVVADDDEFVHTRVNASFSLRYRSKINVQHFASLNFEHRNISSQLHERNNAFLEPLGQKKQRSGLSIVYRLVLDHRDRQHYPLRGYYLKAELRRYGIGVFNDIDLSRLRWDYRQYMTLSQNGYISSLLRGSFSLPLRQAFVDYERLNTFFSVRGYDDFYIQGPLFVHANVLLKRRMFKKAFRFKRLEKGWWRYVSYVPITVYGYFYVNTSWVMSYPRLQKQRFTDELLHGFGPGAEILTFYDLIFGGYYAFTRHGNSLGIYITLRGGN